MPIEIDINDELLADSPQGQFLLAVATAIANIDHEGVSRIVVDGEPKDAVGAEPVIVVMPLPEQPVDQHLMGLHCVRFFARVVEVQESEPHTVRSVGWRLSLRNKLVRRFGGMEAAGASLVWGDTCFQDPKVSFGPLYDDTSRRSGHVRNEITVSADYRGP